MLFPFDDEVEVFGSSMGGVAEEEEVENVMLLCKKEVGGGGNRKNKMTTKTRIVNLIWARMSEVGSRKSSL